MIIKYSKGEIGTVIKPSEEDSKELDNTIKEAYEKKEQELEKKASTDESEKTPFWFNK